MAAIYQTPGVYVEEITKFPPSVAPVETAIPAFIGYTEKAQEIIPNDLIHKPIKIGSLAEYELYFGEGAATTVRKVTLDDNKNFKSAEIGNVFYMYDSLRLFYANGGGNCYIVSVGTYESAEKTANDSIQGINAMKKEDEPTILVFPDNSLLTAPKHFYDVYDAALGQCAQLKDRVALFHVKEDDHNGEEFRSGTGINNLKYGMAYTPWLKVNFKKNITYRDLKDSNNDDVIYVGTTRFYLNNLTNETDRTKEPLRQILEYELVLNDVNKIKNSSNELTSSKTLRAKFTELMGEYQKNKLVIDFINLINYLFEIARKLDKLAGGDSDSIECVTLKDDLKKLIRSNFVKDYKKLISYDKELKEKSVTDYAEQFSKGTIPVAQEWDRIFKDNAPAASTVIDDAANDTEKMDTILPLLDILFDSINNAWLGSVVGAAKELEKKKHEGLLDSFPLYKTIITGIQNTSSSVPPSGAIAGIYAYVDRTRGVWKAPANASISEIVGPTAIFTASQLDALNVDVNSGKSINAIRSFTGKGTLVWGARTLAGNDNEWRYINVRRFFNFAEESIKKATEPFVFEPNDANTWVRVQAMIENFLTTLWRQGALQGVKPEHAFYVAVGLGKTMTALDIQEGRMIIEIGMAVVRPAEFIILKFSHKMAES